MVQESVAGSAVLAVLAASAFLVTGHAQVGIGLAAGIVIGSANGLLIAASVDRAAPFVASSIGRLALLSAVALLAGLLLGGQIWPVVAGAGIAQVVMVGAAVRQGLRRT